MKEKREIVEAEDEENKTETNRERRLRRINQKIYHRLHEEIRRDAYVLLQKDEQISILVLPENELDHEDELLRDERRHEFAVLVRDRQRKAHKLEKLAQLRVGRRREHLEARPVEASGSRHRLQTPAGEGGGVRRKVCVD